MLPELSFMLKLVPLRYLVIWLLLLTVAKLPKSTGGYLRSHARCDSGPGETVAPGSLVSEPLGPQWASPWTVQKSCSHRSFCPMRTALLPALAGSYGPLLEL